MQLVKVNKADCKVETCSAAVHFIGHAAAQNVIRMWEESL
jgi:hypothetical protein